MAKQQQDAQQPELIMRGRFSVYRTPAGDYHVSYRVDDEDQDRHVPIPGMAVRLMNKKFGRDMFSLLGGR